MVNILNKCNSSAQKIIHILPCTHCNRETIHKKYLSITYVEIMPAEKVPLFHYLGYIQQLKIFNIQL